jgi:hypothetical protein
MALFAVFLLGLYLAAGWGVLHARLPRAALLWLAGAALYFVLLSGGVQAVGRYRMPVMPILCLLAGAGLAGRQGMDTT